MNTWNQIPLVRILIPFIAGIIFAISFPGLFDFSLVVVLTLSVILIVSAVFISGIFKNHRTRWTFGLLINCIVFLIACNYTVSRFETGCSENIKNIKLASDTVIATIDDPVIERENSYKIILNVESVKRNGIWKNTEGKVMAYLQKDSISAGMKYGDRIIVCSSFNEIQGRQNPNEFDYKEYLAMRSIYLQSYIKSGKWELLDHDNGNYIRKIALNIREKFLEIFRKYGIEGEEYAVAGALILGYTDKIDQDLINIYSGSGALHILSVSGMHVGVIFIVLNFLLSFLDKTRKGKYFKPVILVLLILFYAAITGLSPAVNRAAAMITFVIIGRMFGRNTNIYNTLAASALLQLVLNPLLIMDVSFQLSYVAVFGIVLLQKKIGRMWQPKGWLVKQVWMLISVSVAAQIATFPLSIFYFHQFPNYFLLTNLIVVPFSNMIIYFGMLVLVASPLALVAALFSKAFVYMLYGLNYSIRFVEGLPYAVTHGLVLSGPETIILYIVIAFAIAFIFNRRYAMLRMAAVISILLFILLAIDKYDAFSQKKIIVYNIKKSTLVDFIDGRDHVIITDSLIHADAKQVKMHATNNWIILRLNDPVQIKNSKMSDSLYAFQDRSFYIENNIIQFYDKRFAFVNEKNFRDISDQPLKVDYLVISGNIKADIDELLDAYAPKLIIFDSSNSGWKTEKWIKQCTALNMPYYSVSKSGAFEEEI